MCRERGLLRKNKKKINKSNSPAPKFHNREQRNKGQAVTKHRQRNSTAEATAKDIPKKQSGDEVE